MRWVDIEVPNNVVDKSSRTLSACYPQRTFYSLSDGPSIQNHQITMTDFRLCLNCHSHSQASLCHYTLKTGFRPVWAYHCAPPLLFGRRPPQSNYPPYSVPILLLSIWLDFKNTKGGISRLTPPKLALWLQSLPPILHNAFLKSV